MCPEFCIVTEEFAGLNSSRGLGTRASGLANQIIKSGYQVDVIITDLAVDSSKDLPDSINFIFLSDICRSQKTIAMAGNDASKSYHIYHYLKKKSYQVIHFSDWLGTGFYCAMARRQGLFRSTVVTHLHASSEWVRLHNLEAPELEDFEREAMERSQIENSDLVISPSQYQLDWYRGRGVSLPEAIKLNWLLPQWHGQSLQPGHQRLATRALEPDAISELIFFARHERRKGFELFIDAVSQLPSDLQPDLTFIGQFDRVGQEFSGSHALRRLADYQGRIRFLNDLNQKEAMVRIGGARNALCVMPFLIENSPCAIGECFTLGIPFLTTDIGGTAELFDPPSRASSLISPHPAQLRDAIVNAMRKGLPWICSTLDPALIAQAWSQCLKTMLENTCCQTQPVSHAPMPLISVCMVHYERPLLLKQALSALMKQSYDNIEIIIVDDGSTSADAHACLDELEQDQHRFPVRIIRTGNRYLGAARNMAASHARGEFLLFHDDDNLAEQNEVEIFVRAALESGCDILTSQCWVFRSGAHNIEKNRRIEYFPLGIGGVYSFFRNRFGDANALFRRTVFHDLGGFTELHGVGWEDWELFLRAFMRGVRIGIVPEPLFNYRVSPKGMLATGDARLGMERLYTLLDEEKPRIGSEFFRYIQRHEMKQQSHAHLQKILRREKASDLHLQLAGLPPNSHEARMRLSDLAFALGRSADAVDLAMGDVRQRKKIAHMRQQIPGADSVNVNVNGPILVTPEQGTGVKVSILRGWGKWPDGRAYVPEIFSIDGQIYERIACLDEWRPDVCRHFQLETGEALGFIVALRHTEVSTRSRQFSSPHKDFCAVPCDAMVSEQITCPASDGGWHVHIDELCWGREVDVAVPGQDGWHGIIRLEAEMPGYFYSSIDGVEYIAASRQKGTESRFTTEYLPDHPGVMKFIIPAEGQVDIMFE